MPPLKINFHFIVGGGGAHSICAQFSKYHHLTSMTCQTVRAPQIIRLKFFLQSGKIANVGANFSSESFPLAHNKQMKN